MTPHIVCVGRRGRRPGCRHLPPRRAAHRPPLPRALAKRAIQRNSAVPTAPAKARAAKAASRGKRAIMVAWTELAALVVALLGE